MNVILMIVAAIILAAIQTRLPTLSWLGGLRLELMPAVVVYASLSLRRGPAIWCAIIAGCVQDSLSAAPFGITALAYGAAAVIITMMGDVLDREEPRVVIGAGALTAALASFAACCVVGFSLGAVMKLVALAGLSAVITPILFYSTDFIRQQVAAT